MKPDKRLSLWLLILCGMVLVMVLGGGYLRESDTSFAILEWRPVSGALPPLSEAAWQHFFSLYAPTPQAHLYHPGLTPASYRALFWPEWRDRLWGRLIFLAFVLPGLLFWRAGRLPRALLGRLAAIFALGLFEAWFGWYLTEEGYAPAGLASPAPGAVLVHFLVAMSILAALFWSALDCRPQPAEPRPHPRLRAALILTALSILCTMALGTQVSAHHIAPPGVLSTPLIAAHIGFASLTALLALGAGAAGLRADITPGLRDRFLVLSGVVALQYILGMSALVSRIPAIGLIHEANAACLLAACLWALHGLGRAAERTAPTGAPA